MRQGSSSKTTLRKNGVFGPLLQGSGRTGRRLDLPGAKGPEVCPAPNVLGTSVEVVPELFHTGR